MKRKKKIIKKIIIGICAVLLAIILTVGGYFAYVLLSYYRVEDNLSLAVEGNGSGDIQVGADLKLLTYNIGFGAYSDDYTFFMDGGEHARALSKEAVYENINGAIDVIQKENPDFILLQEVDVDGTRSYHVDQTAIFSESFSSFDRVYAQNYDSPYLLYPFNEPIGANEAGMMTFSRFNITESVRRSLPIEESLYKLIDIDRAYTVSKLNVENGKTLVIYNLHLSAYTSDGTIADKQLKMLADDMLAEYEKGNYAIAAGDFNKDLLYDSSNYFERTGEEEFTWAKPFDASLLPEGFHHHTGSNFPTCRNPDKPYSGDGSDFVLSVDGVLVTSNIEVISCQTVEAGFAYSDHNPVSVKFKLK